MDISRVPVLMQQLYAVVAEFEVLFNRPFTPDGHLMGSLGEALVAYHYGLTLLPPSNKGYGAEKDGKNIEIKATQGNRVALRSKPDYLIVVRLKKDGTIDEIYNGNGDRVWECISHKPKPSNGQLQIQVSKLLSLNKTVPDQEKIQRIIV